MKWKIFISSVMLSLLLYVFLSFASCSIMKTKTIERVITETVIKIDTVIKVKTDTTVLIRYVRITDTAFIETPQAKAKSYFSTQKQRIVLELNNKPVSVPVSIYKQVRVDDSITKKETVPVKKHNWFIIGILSGVVIFFIIKDRKEIFR
jgi:hypothetical protein